MGNLGQEVEIMLDWIANFAKDSTGGVTRLLYSKEWLNTQQGLESKMKELEFDKVYYDEVGNVFGRLEGSSFKNETILTGSHVDTVKNGGIYDGQYGIVAGILALKYLKEKYGQPLRNIEVVSMAEEEGSRFPYVFLGVKNIFNMIEKEDLIGKTDTEGIKFECAMRKSGFRFKTDDDPKRQDIKAFIEAHIEQGNVLELEKKDIGVVSSIVGQRRFIFELSGQSNHAGTTPMKYRKDTLYTTSLIISNIVGKARKYSDPLVATVGKIDITPNTSNVVPGKTIFTLDVRHTNKGILKEFTDMICEDSKKIAKENDVEIDINMWMDEDPVPMDEKIVNVLKEQCNKENVNYKIMHSGAGHDSQIMAQFVPTAMIFVPSKDGISHSPLEYTETKHLEEGVNLLINSLYELAYK
ncbi:allantoate deiminase [Clostridium senegalense]|uniref:allantoate deiminase n=1 Tax=Clostridium senegalense TaxID=1465809 RepID=UPI00028A2539|nr:allantoate deiminase [Clostridium senegalense]